MLLDRTERDEITAALWKVRHRLLCLELAVDDLAQRIGTGSAVPGHVQPLGELAAAITGELSSCNDDVWTVERRLDGLS